MNMVIACYYNFARCDALQYLPDGSNVEDVIEFILDRKTETEAVNWNDTSTQVWSSEAGNVAPGMWLIRQNGRVWAQNEEPARFDRWVFGIQRVIDSAPREMDEDDALFYSTADPDGHRLFRYPVLNNNWRGGPWEEVV